MSRRYTSPYRQQREEAERELEDDTKRQRELAAALETVRRELESVRSNMEATSLDTRGPPPLGAASSYSSVGHSAAYTRAEPEPMPTYASEASHATPVRAGGVEAYYLERLQSQLGPKHGGIKLYNLLETPMTIEEVFGAILADDVRAARTPRGHQEERPTPWIITDDRWSRDLQKSHFHNVLKTSSAKGAEVNVNFLVLTAPNGVEDTEPKKDLALYAMTYGGAYVAAVSHKLDNTKLVDALTSANMFQGPSIVLAPRTQSMLETMSKVGAGDQPVHYTWDPRKPVGSMLAVSADCKHMVVDPTFLKGEENLSLVLAEMGEDSEHSVESVLEARMAETITEKNRVDENKVVTVLCGSESGQKNGKSAADELCAELKKRGFHVDGGGPVSIDSLPTLDRLQRGGGTAGDGVPRKKMLLVCSTGGVGEFVDGSKSLYKEAFSEKILKDWENVPLKITQAELDLSAVDFAVFGLGDTNYHPGEKHHTDSSGTPWTFCTPAKILDKMFAGCGAKQMTEIGFGDDSEMGGMKPGFDRWCGPLWAALAGGGGEAVDKPKEEKVNGAKYDPGEYIKMGSSALKQPLLDDLMDPSNLCNIQAASAGLSKHHGIYQQKLRDHDIVTEEEKANPFSFMVRLRMPGGDCSPLQMRGLLDISDEFGNTTLKITTRQTLQYHGIVKVNLIEAIHRMNKLAMDTIAACGDVNRNVMCTCLKFPTMDPAEPALRAYERTYKEVDQAAKDVSIHLLPDGLCNSYHEIWVNKGKPNKLDKAYKMANKVYVKGNALKSRPDASIDFEHEPVLKQAYLPRKFKIVIAIPPYNDVDVYAHDIGLIAISDRHGELQGYNISVGGGLGASRHGLTKAFPRLGDVIGYMPKHATNWVCQKIMEIQRDHGCRTDRTHARFKYTVEDKGTDFIKAEINRRVSEDDDCREFFPRGFRLEPARDYMFQDNKDTFGESVNSDGSHNFTLYMQNGRIKNYEEGWWTNQKGSTPLAVKDCLRDVADYGMAHAGTSLHFVLTNNQNLIISSIARHELADVRAILQKHGVVVEDTHDLREHSLLLKNAMACVALPTCGLAMAPAETYLPEFCHKLGRVMDDLDFSAEQQDIIVRASGCPNGCSRPWLGEIALVGRSMEVDAATGAVDGIYDLYIGGNDRGDRFANKYRQGVNEGQIMEALRPLLKEFKREKDLQPRARFGDFCIQRGYVRECKATPAAGRAREPAITFHINNVSREETVSEIAQLASKNVDSMGDMFAANYGIRDFASLKW